MTWRHLLLAMATLVSLPAYAGVGKISSPEVEKGWEAEYSASRSSDGSKALNNKQSHTAELEYGLTDRLMLGLELQADRNAPKSTQFSGVGAEAQYMLTKQTDWWLASAVKAEYAYATHHDTADEAELKLLLARNQGPVRTVANLSLTREMGDHREHGVGFETALQSTYYYHEHFSPGVEWQADYGKVNRFGESNTQEHYLGPIVKGKTPWFDYTAGYYWGLTDKSAAQAARIQLGYDF